MTAKPTNRLNIVVNVAILVTLGALLLSPTGVLRRWFDDWRKSSEQSQLVRAAWDELIEQANIISGGPASQDTVVEFTDYECPFCRTAEPALRAAVANGLTLAVLHLPLEQIHPRAHEAATAAVCADEQGAFANVHHSLLAKDNWTEEGGWEGFAEANGVPEPTSFVDCMKSAYAERRVAAHLALAVRLGVNGTPAFVTNSSVEMGADGLRSVLERAGTASAPEYEMDRIVFESADFPHDAVSALGSLVDGLMLAPDRILLADSRAASLLFIDLDDHSVTAVGHRGDGPGDFRSLWAVGRAQPSGIFTHDPVGAKVTLFADDGSLVRALTYNPLTFRGHVMVPRPIGAYADGTVVFRDADPMFTERPEGPYREKFEYLLMMPDESRTTIAEAPGREMVRRNFNASTFSAYEKPFSYSSLDATVEDLVLVADTESGDVTGYDHAGNVVSTFSFGPGTPVSRAIDARWREERIATEEKESRAVATSTVPVASELLGAFGGTGDGEEEFYRTAEGNAVTPAMARMLVDGDGRVWVQRFTLPGAETVVWQRWHRGEGRIDGTIRIPSEYKLLDAIGDRVLLRSTDEFDVPHATVSTLRVAR